MCEANVYLLNQDGEEELYLESVNRIVPEVDRLVLEDIFGQKKLIRARIKEMSLVEHRILLERERE